MDDMLFIAQKFKRVQGSENRNVTVLKTLFKPTKLLLMILKQLNNNYNIWDKCLNLHKNSLLHITKECMLNFFLNCRNYFLYFAFLNHNTGYLYVLPLSYFSSNEIFSFSCTKQSQPSKKSLLQLVWYRIGSNILFELEIRYCYDVFSLRKV